MITASHILETIINLDKAHVQEIMDEVETVLKEYKGQTKTLLEMLNILENSLHNYAIIFEPSNNKDSLLTRAANIKMQNGVLGILFYCGELLPQVLTDPSVAKTFREHFKALLEHELVHKEQNVRRMLKQRRFPPPSQFAAADLKTVEIVRRYLSDPQELMAYAKSILRELQNYGYSKEEILSRLRSGTFTDIRDVSGLLDDYAKYFSHNDPTMKRFLSYIYQYARELD